MKRSSCKSPLSGASEKRINLCQSEVLPLIEQEVRCAIKRNETRLDSLIEGLQQMECDIDFESSMQKLEARFNMVKKRADAALAYVMQTGITKPEDIKGQSDKNREICQMMEMTTKTLRKIQTVSEDLTANIQYLKRQPPQADHPPCSSVVPAQHKETNTETVITQADNKAIIQHLKQEVPHEDLPQYGSTVPAECKKSTAKTKIKVQTDNEALPATIQNLKKEVPQADLPLCGSVIPAACKTEVNIVKKEPDDHCRSPKKVRPEKRKEECLSPGDHRAVTHAHSKDKLVYPPLPPTIFPSVLNVEAASYNIPQRPSLQLALIRNPPGLSVLWNVEEYDPSAPPMDSYSIYMAVEKVKGSGVFPEWRSLGEVTAIKLPMCVLVSKYKPGYKVCVTVVGKDKFGRYGPYSKVVHATIPEFLT
ncbi:activating transcription factor 7-interacting protein 2 isoform X2 [Thalassophryne amazonica]|uniref:activating transcription factor 7-interacting protein 2 isoform X2 n=1 Tax=Thalassophryne amazonica TaxID=390379 RepID=UPI001470C58A|nr:activating transcription factor 7-interacting protein 2 isoform X2 [Thalassophryne amazonica]